MVDVAAGGAVLVKIGAHLDHGAQAGALTRMGHGEEVVDQQGTRGVESAGQAGKMQTEAHIPSCVNNTINAWLLQIYGLKGTTGLKSVRNSMVKSGQ